MFKVGDIVKIKGETGKNMNGVIIDKTDGTDGELSFNAYLVTNVGHGFEGSICAWYPEDDLSKKSAK